MESRVTTPTQAWNPEEYARNVRFVAELGIPVVDLLAPVAGERILDLGCGDGYLTARLVTRGCDVLGVDASGTQWRRRGRREYGRACSPPRPSTSTG